MRLQTTGREYATWTVTGADEYTTLDVSFDRGATWHPLEPGDPGKVRILVAGPTTTNNPAGTAVLDVGRNTATIRATDNPEVVIRDAGAIDVT